MFAKQIADHGFYIHVLPPDDANTIYSILSSVRSIQSELPNDGVNAFSFTLSDRLKCTYRELDIYDS